MFPGVTSWSTACTQFFLSISASGGTQAQTVTSRARTSVRQARCLECKMSGSNAHRALAGPWEWRHLKLCTQVPPSLPLVLTLPNRVPSLHHLLLLFLFLYFVLPSFLRQTDLYLTNCWGKQLPTNAGLFSYRTWFMRARERAFHFRLWGGILNGWAWITGPLHRASTGLAEERPCGWQSHITCPSRRVSVGPQWLTVPWVHMEWGGVLQRKGVLLW